jgi:hypothetical protein
MREHGGRLALGLLDLVGDGGALSLRKGVRGLHGLEARELRAQPVVHRGAPHRGDLALRGVDHRSHVGPSAPQQHPTRTGRRLAARRLRRGVADALERPNRRDDRRATARLDHLRRAVEDRRVGEATRRDDAEISLLSVRDGDRQLVDAGDQIEPASLPDVVEPRHAPRAAEVRRGEGRGAQRSDVCGDHRQRARRHRVEDGAAPRHRRRGRRGRRGRPGREVDATRDERSSDGQRRDRGS